MTEPVQRTSSGQFRKGQSGNAAGARARKPKRLMTSADIDLLILDVASRATPLRTEKGTEEISLLEWNVRALGSGKRVGTAPRSFVDLVKSSARMVELRAEREAEGARRRNAQ